MIHPNLAGAILSSLIVTFAPLSEAATYYWDANLGEQFNQNGSGGWSSSSANWTQGVDAQTPPANVNWSQGNHTVYLGSGTGYTNMNVGGTITLEEAITLSLLEKSSLAGAYTIVGNGHTLTLLGAQAGIGNNATNSNAALTLDAIIAGDQGLKKTLGGTVIFAQDNVYTGGTRIAAHSTVSTDTSSVLQIGQGGTSGSLGEGAVRFVSAGPSSGQSVLEFRRSNDLSLNEVLESDSEGPNLGILRQNGSGVLRVTSDNADFSGAVEVLQGTLVVGDGAEAGHLSEASGVAVSAGAVFAFDRTDGHSFQGTMDGAGTVEKRNTGTLSLGGTGSTHSGRFRVLGGTVSILNDQALASTSTLELADGVTFDVGEHTQRVSTLHVESGATAFVRGSGTLQLGSQSVMLGANVLNESSTLDMRGLANLSFEGGTTYDFTIGGNVTSNTNVQAVTSGIVYLADHNVIKANRFNVGTISAGGSSPKNAGYVYLGQTNEITANEISIGGTLKNQAGLSFRSDVTDGMLTIRGTNSAQRATLFVGRHNSGFVSVEESYFDTTAGTLDAMFATMVIGHNQDAASPARGRFSMGAGTLNATHLVLGRRSAVSTANTSAVFELKGGRAKIDNITMGDAASTGETGKIESTFRLLSGELSTKTIVAGAGLDYGVRKFEWTSGLISTFDNNTSLNSTGVDFHLKAAASGTREFNVAANQTIAIAGNFVNDTGTASYQAFTKRGNGTLVLGGTVGGAPTILMQGGHLRLDGSNLLGSGGALEFSQSGNLNLQGHQQTLSNLKLDAGVNVVVQGTAGSALHLVGGTGTMVIGGTAATSLDVSSLSEFSFVAAGRSLIWGGQGNAATSQATVKLSLQSNTLVAKALLLNSVQSGNTLGQNQALVELGKSNTLHMDTFQIGGIKSKSTLTFAASVSDAEVVIRNTAGTGRANMTVGDNKSSALRGEALVDFSAGTVDAWLDQVKIGINTNEGGQNRPTLASFKMSKGVVDANTLILGAFNGPNSANVNEPLNNVGEGTFELKGTGTLKVSELQFAQKTGTGIGFASGIMDLEAGTLKAASIRQLANDTYGKSSFLWRSGTVQNYDAATDLEIQNVNLTLEGEAGARVFQVDANRKVVLHSSIVDGSQASTQGFNKAGAGRLELRNASSYAGKTLVSQGALWVGNSTGSATGSGAIEVSLGAQLMGNGILKPTGANGITVAGLLEVGDLGDTSAQTLTFDLSETSGSFLHTGTLAISLFSNIGDNRLVNSAADQVRLLGIGSSQVEVSGSLLISLGNAGLSFEEGDRWKIFDLANNSVATLGAFDQITSSGFTLGSGLTWQVERDLQGIYAVVAAVPEPSRTLFWGLSLALLVLRRRRA